MWKRAISLRFAGSPLPPSAGEAGKVSTGREDQAGRKELSGFAIHCIDLSPAWTFKESVTLGPASAALQTTKPFSCLHAGAG